MSQLNLKKPAYFTGRDLDNLREKIKGLAEVLRAKKTAGTASKDELLSLIGDLLELKFLDEENQDCVVRWAASCVRAVRGGAARCAFVCLCARARRRCAAASRIAVRRLVSLSLSFFC